MLGPSASIYFLQLFGRHLVMPSLLETVDPMTVSYRAVYYKRKIALNRQSEALLLSSSVAPYSTCSTLKTVSMWSYFLETKKKTNYE